MKRIISVLLLIALAAFLGFVAAEKAWGAIISKDNKGNAAYTVVKEEGIPWWQNNEGYITRKDETPEDMIFMDTTDDFDFRLIVPEYPQMALFFEADTGNIIFQRQMTAESREEEVLKFCPGGKIYINGERAGTYPEVVMKMSEWLSDILGYDIRIEQPEESKIEKLFFPGIIIAGLAGFFLGYIVGWIERDKKNDNEISSLEDICGRERKNNDRP